MRYILILMALLFSSCSRRLPPPSIFCQSLLGNIQFAQGEDGQTFRLEGEHIVIRTQNSIVTIHSASCAIIQPLQ